MAEVIISVFKWYTTLEKQMPEQPLEIIVGDLLRDRKLTIATAESCTGGLLGHILTDTPGSSVYFLGGIIAYAYGAKENLLGVRHETLWQYMQSGPGMFRGDLYFYRVVG